MNSVTGRAVGSDKIDADTGRRILDPGRNCWRIARASRAAVLIDAEAYFFSLEQALRKAKRSILIIGWDFDADVRLRAGGVHGRSETLSRFLRLLVESRPELDVRILVWNLSPVYTPGAALPLIVGDQWQDHPRISLRLDSAHPIYGAQHQKIVSIDDSLAFVGGIDLTVERWDTPSHSATDPLRRNRDGAPYDPVHDVQMAVDGDAARAVASVARDRWRIATGEALPPTDIKSDPWPSNLHADFAETPVAIARTAPAWRGNPAIREVAALTADALSAAKRLIYIEAQYLAHSGVGDILARLLEQAEGPEIVILVTRIAHGVFERFIMGGNRDRLIRRLRRADRYDRLRVYYPVVPAPDGERDCFIHAKLIIVDDDFLRIGSSNLNNRSMALDTECDLAIEASSEATRRSIATLRKRLVAEHLGVARTAVERAVADQGSLVRAIDRLNNRPRGLRAFSISAKGPIRLMPGTRLLDPLKPIPFLSMLYGRRPKRR